MWLLLEYYYKIAHALFSIRFQKIVFIMEMKFVQIQGYLELGTFRSLEMIYMITFFIVLIVIPH